MKPENVIPTERSQKQKVTYRTITFIWNVQNVQIWEPWVARSVRHLTLDLSSGLDLRVMTSSPALGSMLGIKPTLKNKEKNSNSIRGNEENRKFQNPTEKSVLIISADVKTLRWKVP